MLCNQLGLLLLKLLYLLTDGECFCWRCHGKSAIDLEYVHKVLLEVHSVPILEASILIIGSCCRKVHCEGSTILLIEEECSLGVHS